MDEVEHLAVPGDLLFRSVLWRCLVRDDRLDALLGSLNAFDGVRSFSALDACDLLQSLQLLWKLVPVGILLAFGLVNLAEEAQGLRWNMPEVALRGGQSAHSWILVGEDR